ncbi:unnamed protein product [Microthlaspi erraticum]|uniref:Retrotransposon gag domain-containing protein n=1 Tax=Microthlaspi erraticum TaxID=1685480 RepID=A0A6D2JK59_9BRAS|nr:unnamed protein product [Microthlaspi erraticum]
MTRRSNKDNLVEHPEIDKLEKQLRKQKAQEMADEAARAHAAEVARAQEEGRDPPPPPPNPQDLLEITNSMAFQLSIPLDHIENFEEICSTTRSNGVSADYLKCKLFSFSLGDKASRWLKSLPAHSITTWDEYKAAFINHFYTKQRSISVRNKISTFAKPTMNLSMRR